jgi:two-component system OmpR family response regulator
MKCCGPLFCANLVLLNRHSGRCDQRMQETSVLIIEDDSTLREVLAYNLRQEGYRVLEAADGGKGLDIYRVEKPSLIILDLMLPVLSGLEVCRIVNSEKKVPIIMLTAKALEVDKIVGLEMGADDYMTKPFSMRELLARIKAVLRRSQADAQKEPKGTDGSVQYLEAHGIKVDLSSHSVSRAGRTVELNPKEFELLAYLMSNKGRVISREQVLRNVWGYDYIGGARTVDVHMRWLRRKLEDDAEKPVYLLTVRGYGYKFEV